MSDPKSFLILNAVIVTLLVLSFLALRKKEKPSRLNFKKDVPLEKLPVVPVDIPLNVIFNYNGHSFDAYEALGVPAGSNLEEVKAGLARSIAASADPTSTEFYKVAFEAIQKAAVPRR